MSARFRTCGSYDWLAPFRASRKCDWYVFALLPTYNGRCVS